MRPLLYSGENMKKLYVIAGGSDGYVDFTHTFDKAEADSYMAGNECYDSDGYHNVSVLLVPDDFEIKEGTYEYEYHD